MSDPVVRKVARIKPVAVAVGECTERRRHGYCRRPLRHYTRACNLTESTNSKNERIKLVEKKAKEFGITVLLKGATDVISNGSTTYLYEKKTPAMTVGGTGDVLSGLVAGLLSNNRNPLESAAAATFINGLAGKSAQKKLGLHMTSMDLLDEIPSVMKPFDRIV